MTNTISNAKTISLLKEIDEETHFDNTEWNKNAFQAILTSNLSNETIFYYATNVGLRWLENSLYETYWDVTMDALNSLSTFLFNSSICKDDDNYLYEAKCQLLMYSAIAIIKLNIIRRRSIHDAKMACATICFLLLERTKSYQVPSVNVEHSTCTRSMYSRYLTRMFITGQWLLTLSEQQSDDLKTNYDRYISIITNQLFSVNSSEDNVNRFIDKYLFGYTLSDDDEAASGFVFVRQFPSFVKSLIYKQHDSINMGLANALDQCKNNTVRKLICSTWTLCCMIESHRTLLETINSSIACVPVSSESMDFNERSIDEQPLNERDIMVFLLLCAQQNVHLNNNESILHPYLLFSLTHLCTQQQKHWFQAAVERTSLNEFNEHLATIRLDDRRASQHPPKLVMLRTAQILFQSALDLYKSKHKYAARSYEEYAKRYFQTAQDNKNTQELSDSFNRTNIQGNKQEKLFFFYSTKSRNLIQNDIDQLIQQCEILRRQCDEAKQLLSESEPPKTSSPARTPNPETNISTVLSPVSTENEEQNPSQVVNSTLFATPPSIKTRDIDVQTITPSPSPPPPIEEVVEQIEPPLPTYADTIFAHMNDVNEWINQFCFDHEIIQNDINTIRDRLDKISRITSQMMFSNMKISTSEIHDNPGGFYSSR